MSSNAEAAVLLTDEVKSAARELLNALGEACEHAQLTRVEAEGRVSLFLANLGDDLDAVAQRLPAGDQHDVRVDQDLARWSQKKRGRKSNATKAAEAARLAFA